MKLGRLSILMVCVLLLAGCGEDTEGETADQVADQTGDQQQDTTVPDATADGEDSTADLPQDVSDPDAPADIPIEDGLTWYGDVKAIVDARCSGTCHVDGGLGPFPLETYDDVVLAQSPVRKAVVEKTMPPWGADGACRDYHGDTSLTDAQIQTITDWMDAGAPEGDPADEGPPLDDTSTRLSRTDLTLQMEQPYISQIAPDDYRCFVLDWPHTTTKYITGLGVTPGNEQVVHHLVGYIAQPGLEAEIQRLEDRDPEPGYTCFGDPKVGSFIDLEEVRWMGSWAPGGVGQDFPEGTGLLVEPGSKIIIQMHYNTLGTQPQPDQTSVHFKLDDTVEKEAFYLPWANPDWFGNGMHIAAGDADATHSWGFDPSIIFEFKPITVYSANLHMHTLGTAARASMTIGTQDICLLDIPEYDFGWQREYMFREPEVLSITDRLNLECHWDNSLGNPNRYEINGQPLPVQDVNWGDGTTDEMCLGVFYVTID